jgi:phosphate transport system substrate-binding protein
VVRLRFATFGGAIALMLGIAACGDREVRLSGSIRIDGSRSIAPLTRTMVRRFTTEHPGVHISLATSTTQDGFERLCRGETDVNDAVTRIDVATSRACRQAGVAWTEIPVANDAVIVVVHPETGVRCVTTTQLTQIWHRNSEVTDSWTQVDHLNPPYDGNLNAWGPGTDTETFRFFNTAVNGRPDSYRDYNNMRQDEGRAIWGATTEPGNIAYVQYRLYARDTDAVRALALDSGSGCVAPSRETIANGSYRPLSHRLFIYVSVDAAARPAMQAFLRYYLDNLQSVAADVGFVPLTDAQLEASKQRLEQLIEEAAPHER